MDVKAAKVVAGLEPENTNMFLLSLVDCASDSSYDNATAVRRVLAGEAPGQSPPPLTTKAKTTVVAESKNDDGIGSKGQIGDDDAKGALLESKPRGDAELLSERGKSRGGTRGGKPQTSSSDMGLNGSASAALNLDPEIERCDGTEGTTQGLLGELITRPKLSEKLLSKPPFRFLHDIIMEIIKATGFAAGLYTPNEIDSALVTDKNQKLQFLEKIIKVVGIQLNTLVQAKPAKIVAGLDVQNTNNFLQLLAVCAKHAPESKQAVRTVLEQMGSEGGEMTTESTISRPERSPVHQVAQKSEPKEEVVTGKFDDKNDTVSDDNRQAANIDGDDTDMKRSTRPTTARRRPPKVKEGAKEVGRDIAPAPKKTEGILIDGQNDDDDEVITSETRLTDEMKADFKADKSKESKLVQDIRGRQAEQEAAIAPVKDQVVDENDAAMAKTSSGIRLGRLRKTGNEKKATGPNTSVISAPLSDGDIDRLRSAIQILVQHTGPLGTCMDYIQEDIGMMTAELHKWEDDCRKYEAEVEVEIRRSHETLHPLRMEQHDLDDQISEQIAKISSVKAQIARNDERIQQILKLVVNS